MAVRCPYCGKKTISHRVKIGACTIGRSLSPRCPACGNRCVRDVPLKGNGLPVALFATGAALFTAGIFAGFFLSSLPLLAAGVVLLLLLYFLGNLFLSHFDKLSLREREDNPRFMMELPQGVRLWPSVRRGEIFTLSPGGNKNPPATITGLLERTSPGENGTRLTFRILACQDISRLPADTTLRLESGRRSIPGRVVAPGVACKNPSGSPLSE